MKKNKLFSRYQQKIKDRKLKDTNGRHVVYNFESRFRFSDILPSSEEIDWNFTVTPSTEWGDSTNE